MQAHWNFYYWSTLLEDPKSNIADEVIEYENGKLQCTFTFKANPQIHVPPPADNDVSFNLNEESFYLLLAKGPLAGNKIQIHQVKDISSEPIKLSETRIVSKIQESIYDNCGKTKGCFGFPDECVANNSCDALMTYIGIDGNTYHIEIQAKGQTYVAGGFGTVKGMGPAVVTACSKQSSNSMVPNIAMYYNRGYVTPDLLTNSTLAISSPNLTYTDGVLWCSFNMEANVPIPDPKDDTNIFNLDLNNDAYNLLLGIGPLSPNGQVGFHTDKLVSSDQYNLADFNLFYNKTNIFDGCDNIKGCFGLPDGCMANKSCETLMTYVGIDENTYHIEMQTSGQDYVAGGFGIVKGMGPAVVTACSKQSSNSTVPNIAMYYNRGPMTPDLLTNSSLAISNPNLTYTDGVLWCNFDMEAKVPIPDPKNSTNIFNLDLNNDAYNILLAIGPVNPNGQVGYHKDRLVSSDQYNLADFNLFYNKTSIFDGCDDTKGCFGLTDGCVEDKSCASVMTYVGIDENTYHIEMQTSSESYVATGFGTVKDMGPAIIVACSQKSNFELYYNSGKVTPNLLPNTTLAISNTNLTYSDGVLLCSFDIQAIVKVSHLQDCGEYLDLDLNNVAYHLLLGIGPMQPDGHVGFHTDKIVSNETYNLADFNPFLNSNYDGCQETKGCFGLPGGCVNQKTCSILLTYAQLDNGDVDFTLTLTKGQIILSIAF